jgi:hypothetical protein
MIKPVRTENGKFGSIDHDDFSHPVFGTCCAGSWLASRGGSYVNAPPSRSAAFPATVPLALYHRVDGKLLLGIIRLRFLDTALARRRFDKITTNVSRSVYGKVNKRWMLRATFAKWREETSIVALGRVDSWDSQV